MGRYWLHLDPDNFYYTAEPGAHFEWAGPDYLSTARAGFKTTNPGLSMPVDYGFTVPSSERPAKLGHGEKRGVHPWVLCTPRQTHSNWTQDDRLDAHVLRDGDEWTWAAEVTVREWQPTLKPGETGFPANKWQTVYVPETVTSLYDLDWTAIGNAAGLDIPADMAVVGVASAPPSGGDFQNLTPQILYNQPPGPDDLAVFGFGEYCIVFNANGISLVQATDTGFKHLGAWPYDEGGDNLFTRRGPGVMSVPSLFANIRSCMVLNVPPAHLSLFFGGKQAVTVETYPVEGSEVRTINVTAGAWWVAVAPKTKLQMQMQVIGYENVNTVVLRVPTTYPDFDLGTSYRPNIEPSLNAHCIVHSPIGQGPPVASISTNEYSAEDGDTGESVTLSLLTGGSPGSPWSSDGVNHAGFWGLEMVAATDRIGGYTAPAIRDWVLKFPVFLAPRLNNPLLLDDTQFVTFDAETGLSPDDKRVTVTLWDKGAALLRDEGFDTREGYPIQILEDTDADDEPDTVRVTAWVHDPEIEELVTETDDRDLVRQYRLNARGLLSRGGHGWIILPQMVDPSGGGYVEHVYAVREAILAMGLDVSDPTQWQVATDTMAGTARSRLPGTIANRPYSVQLDKSNPYAPAYDEPPLDYALRIATQWAGWVLYERLDGLVWYHPALMFELALGVNYFVSASAYYSTAEAEDASSPGQHYLANLSELVRPVEANSVRIIGKEDADFNPVMVNDSLGWQSDIYENFVGEPRGKTYSLELAVDQESAEILASVALLTLGQRGVDWPIEVQLAPWDWVSVAPVGVGYCITVQGKGDRLITHEQVTLLRSRSDADGGSILRTRLTTTRLPAASSALVVGVVPYPGRINPV